jgi:tetratricopeptide (TPR) repeat protein
LSIDARENRRVVTDKAEDQAREALRRADWDAGRAAPFAVAAVRRARQERDSRALSVAYRAWGRSLLQCGDVAAAIAHLRRSIRAAEAAGAPDLAAESRIPLAAAWVQRGNASRALAALDAALPALDTAGRARALAQRANVLHQNGSLDDARAEYEEAVRLLRRVGDSLNLQRCLSNRGILHTELHRFEAARRDLLEAEALARTLGRELAGGIIAENIGYLETLRGDVPAALAQLQRAEDTIGALGGQLGPVFLDRAELLLSVGLHREAHEAAELAAAAFSHENRGREVPWARLVAAQASLLGRDPRGAVTAAVPARRQFAGQGRAEYAALAELTICRATLLGTGRGPRTASLLRMVDQLGRAGWPVASAEARVAAAELLLRRGQPALAATLLEAAAATRRSGTAARRAVGWYAAARLRQLGGDRRGAAAGVRAGLRVLDEHVMVLQASDLRSHSAVHRTALAELALRDAVRAGTARQLFTWAERSRATRSFDRPVRPPDDPALAGLLEELRVAARSSWQDPAASGTQSEVERRIRDYCRMRPAAVSDSGPVDVSLARLRDRLGNRVLVELVGCDGELHAVTLSQRIFRRHLVGSVAEVADLVARVRFGLRRLSDPSTAARSAALRQLLTGAAARLDRLLLPVTATLDERPVVVVPTGPLHNLPWSLLPSLAGRPVTVAPSAGRWAGASHAAGESAVAVAGPGLPGARSEALAVARIHAGTSLAGDAATVDAVLTALGTARVVHLAAHGRLALPNALFSSILLADGPLVVYDLEGRQSTAHTVVLASCNAGEVDVRPGDEMLGLSAAFMARGTAQLVAPVVRVPDAATKPLMTAFHRRLAAGATAAESLAAAQEQQSQGGDEELAAAAGFVCFATAGA